MKRRNFVKTSAAAVGLIGSLPEVETIMAEKAPAPQKKDAPLADNRHAEYLERVQKSQLSPGSLAGKKYLIQPMPVDERLNRKLIPQHGFCSIAPGELVSEALISGNGTMNIELLGNPFSEQILFHHESLVMPWKKPLEAPDVSKIFPEVRQMLLDGKTKEAVALALKHMNETPVKQDTEPHLTVPAFLMKIDLPASASPKNYIRTVDFETGELKVFWIDEKGDWLRRVFTSRPDNVVVQWLTAPEGSRMNIRITQQKSASWTMSSGMDWGALKGIGSTDPDMSAFANLAAVQKDLAPAGVEKCKVRQEIDGQWLIYKCLLDESIDHSGYAGLTRVISKDGTVRSEKGSMVVDNATSVILVTRIEYFDDYSDLKVESVRMEVEKITPDYSLLLENHHKAQSEILHRVKVNFGGAEQNGMSAEELLADQRTRPDFSPALLEKVYEMGRYWFLLNAGKYPAIAPGINSTINLLMAGAVQGDMTEGTRSFFKWMDEIAPDCRKNASNVFGFGGTSYPLFPGKGTGASFYYTSNTDIGLWPYWISSSGWLARNFWEHYLVTGDVDFLRDRVVPVYKEIAQFYEDFLTITDLEGNYIFVPSVSPENIPRNIDPSGPILVNATMDIAVCRDVLSCLIEASETLGIETGNIEKWKTMLSKMPPYHLELDGTLKEWSWPSLQEHYSHRHVSHLYGVWPGDDIDPDGTPELALAAEIANRRRTFDTMSTAVAGETLPAYGRCHRALAGARLKDNIIVDVQLRQLLEQGYVSPSLRCSREPYGIPVPDAHGGIPAIIHEMLLYSRPGIIEILPALPESLMKGSISGLLSRSFARINNLEWDMSKRMVDLTITSLRNQDVVLIARKGIEDITSSSESIGSFRKGKADCILHLKANEQVKFHLELGENNIMDWVAFAK
ncbi:MAG TPA: glycoside hydrolase N-terminal domain-containing protein [Bacteroidales bacterium]|nr:glycoside hydrolase N-terminal domain-containing protein [Bacteroidales bacterium]